MRKSRRDSIWQLITLAVVVLLSTDAYAREIQLANDEWPPFIREGVDRGKAERLVCQALERAGYACAVQLDEWDRVLQQAETGDIDGIVAVWKTPEREAYMLFSEPYLTNRIVPVVSNRFDAVITSPRDLQGMRVALVMDYAYGADIDAMRGQFEEIASSNSAKALESVRSGKADVALVDELVAREKLKTPGNEDLTILKSVLAFRSLHFAVSRKNQNAATILADFHGAYQAMLEDGTVNEILEVDWLATDFGSPGSVSVVMREGVSLDDLDNPNESGGMYALDESDYQWMRDRGASDSRVNYQVSGKSYSNLNQALSSAFGKDAVCKHNDYSSTFDCTELFKSRN